MDADAKKDFADENGLVLLSSEMLTYCSSQYYISQLVDENGQQILEIIDNRITNYHRIKCYGCYGGSWEGLIEML